MNGDASDNILWLFVRASLPVRHIMHDMADRHAISVAQVWALCLLEPDHEVPMNSLSSALGCDASNVTGIADKLLQGGFIERCECKRDRRIKIISLTAEGRALRTLIMQHLKQAETKNLAHLSKDELETLRSLLQKTLPEKKPTSGDTC